MFAYKIVMIGDFGVGKTSLVRRFVDNSFSEDYLSSIGVSISKKVVEDSTIMLWDIEGKTEFKPIYKSYLLGAKGFIIVADLTRPETLDAISEHIRLCSEIVKDAPIVIALNKSDIEHSLFTSVEDIKKLSPNILDIFKTSAKSGNSVNEIFHLLNTTLTEAQ